MYYQRFVTSIVCFFLVSVGAAQVKQALYPVKIALEANRTIVAGKNAQVTIVLLNADNKPTNTPELVTVNVNVRWPSGKTAQFEVPITAGTSSGKLEIPMKAKGLCRIHATQENLLGAGTHIIVLDVAQERPTLTATPSIRREPRPDVPMRSPGRLDGIIVPRIPDLNVPAAPQIQFHFSPDNRELLADGKDSAEILALVDGVLTSDVRVVLHNSAGSLLPKTLLIRKDEPYAYAKVASNRVDEVTVSMVSAMPNLGQVGAPLKLKFIEPIVGFICAASPPDISLVDETDVVITLVDEQGKPRSTDVQRTISLAISDGRGELSQEEVIIPPGKTSGRASFMPTRLGDITILSSTDRLKSEKVTFRVTWPLLLIVLSAVGGTVGGFIAKLRNKTESWRIFIGIIAGFVLYWALIFGLLQEMPRAVVLNPLSAFTISVIGGWGGINIFNALLSKFGVGEK